MKVMRKYAREAGQTLSRWGMNAGHFVMSRNGEARLVRTLAERHGIAVALDIGMNAGGWAALVKEAAPEAVVHGVEPVPEFAEKCRARNMPGVSVHEVAVSDAPGEIVIYRKGGGARSTDFGAKPGSLTAYPVRALTGDTLVEELGLTALSLVKIDTDGNDVPALRGLSGSFERMRPVVQFEYSRFWIGTRHYLHDAFAVMEPLGYRLGPLMPRGVWLGPYTRKHEIFQTCNFVAIPEEHPALASLSL